MSLFGTLGISTNALQANQLGLQVVANNVANANTPGYIRQRLDLQAAEPQRIGALTVGLGVQVAGITQQFDKFLSDRLRGATSGVAEGDAKSEAYQRLETLVGALGDQNLGASLSQFFSNVQNVLNQPESRSIRNLVRLQGESLASDIRSLYSRVEAAREDANTQIVDVADQINSLVRKISSLNVKVMETEGGTTSKSDAVGVRDERNNALDQLAELIDIRVAEQPTGDVTVFAGGDYLVFQGTHRDVVAKGREGAGLLNAEIRLADSDAPIQVEGGKLNGLVAARDEVFDGYLKNLDAFAKALAFEFNKLHSSGQGLVGHSNATSEFAVDNVQKPLDEAGLRFTPQNGSFQVKTTNRQTGLTTTTDVRVDLNGLDADTTLESLVQSLDAIDGVTAAISPDRRLRIGTDSANVTFAFANDTSGALAALGINTFFSGVGARDIDVAATIKAEPAKFAASAGGVGVDSKNAERMAQLLSAPLASQGGDSLAVMYDRTNSEVAQGASVAKSLADGQRVFQQALQGQQDAISGVSIDEEIARMMAYQRAYQASARVISTIDKMLDVLVNL